MTNGNGRFKATLTPNPDQQFTATLTAGVTVIPPTLQDEGTPLTLRTAINFAGEGVTAADDPANNRTTVTIPGDAVPSVFGRSGAPVVAMVGDYTAAQVTNAVDQTVVYQNPAWIGSLSWDKVAAGAPPVSSYQTPWLQDINGAGFRLKSAKAISVGPAPSADDSSYLSSRTATNPLSLGGSHAFRDENTYNSSIAGDAGYASYDAVAIMQGTGALNHLNAFQARPQYAGTGNLDSLVSFNSQVAVNGPVANLFAVRIYDPSGSGAITNQYGIWIDPLSRGSSANYAIFAAGNNPTYLGGTLQIGAGFTLAGNINGATYMLASAFVGAATGADTAVLAATSVQFQTSGAGRWTLVKANPETGSDAGSDFLLRRYNDAGSLLDVPFQVARATGYVGIDKSPAYRLDVAGDVNATAYRINGAIWNPQTPWTGDIDAAGFKLINASKGNLFGTPGGPVLAPAPTDANIRLYDLGSGNWAGIGSDSFGSMWFRTGLSGSPNPGLVIHNSGKVGIQETNPRYPLSVGGDINITGSYRINDIALPTSLAGFQTPWVGDVDANGHKLTGVTVLNTGGLNLVASTPYLSFYVGPGLRWQFLPQNPETGSNVGSDLVIASFKDDSSFLASALVLKRSTGALGIGVSPAFKLDVAGDINTTGAYRINGVALPTSVAGFQSPWVTDVGAAGHILSSVGRIGVGIYPQTVLHVNGTGAAPSLTANNQIFTIDNDITQTLAFGAMPGAPYAMWLQTKTNNNNGASYPIALNPLGGSVGIGTANPQAALHVSKGVSGAPLYAYTNLLVESSSHNGMQFSSAAGMQQAIMFGTPASGQRAYVMYDDSSSKMYFATPPGAAGSAIGMTLTGSGSLGIGTLSPQAMLDVAGNINVAGSASLTRQRTSAGSGLQLNLISPTGSTFGPGIVFSMAGVDSFQLVSNGSRLEVRSFDGSIYYPLAASTLLLASLPTTNPGAGSKQLWYDPADGNRVKYAV